MNLKRVLSMALVLAMMLALLPVGAVVVTAAEPNTLEYNFNGTVLGKSKSESITAGAGATGAAGTNDWTYVGFKNVQTAHILLDGLRFGVTGDDQTLNSGNTGAVVKISVPKAGTYKPTVAYGALKSGLQMKVYMLKTSDVAEDAQPQAIINSAATATHITLKDGIDTYDSAVTHSGDNQFTKTIEVDGDAVTLEATDYYVVFKPTGKNESAQWYYQNTNKNPVWDYYHMCVASLAFTEVKAPLKYEFNNVEAGFAAGATTGLTTGGHQGSNWYFHGMQNVNGSNCLDGGIRFGLKGESSVTSARTGVVMKINISEPATYIPTFAYGAINTGVKMKVYMLKVADATDSTTAADLTSQYSENYIPLIDEFDSFDAQTVNKGTNQFENVQTVDGGAVTLEATDYYVIFKPLGMNESIVPYTTVGTTNYYYMCISSLTFTETEPAPHVHDFGTTGTCSCGEVAEAKVGDTYYETVAEAVAAADTNVVVLNKDVATVTVEAGKTLNLDLNGHNVAALEANGTVYGSDSSTMDYSNTAYGKITTVTGSGLQAIHSASSSAGSDLAKTGYVTYVDAEGATSFHHFKIAITDATLRSCEANIVNEAEVTSAGIGYKLALAGNAQVIELLDSYGAEVYEQNSVSGPSASASADNLVAGEQVKLIMIKNILHTGNDAGTNASGGKVVVCVKGHIKFKDGTQVDVSYSGGKSVKDLLAYADTHYDDYGTEEQAALVSFYNTYIKGNTDAFKDWTYTNIATAAGAAQN